MKLYKTRVREALDISSDTVRGAHELLTAKVILSAARRSAFE